MSYLDTYRTLLGNEGRTARERNIKHLKRGIELMAPHNPAYQPIVVDGVETHAIIKSKDDYFIKEVVSMPDEYIKLGSVVTLFGKPWISLKRDFDDEVYAKSWVYLCSTKLRWKDKNGEIHERDCWAEDATKYSEGVETYEGVRVAEFQLKCRVTLDEYTNLIHRDMRFMIEVDDMLADAVAYGNTPTVFKVTRRNVVTGTYQGEGYIEVTLIEDSYIEGKDDYTTMLAAQPDELIKPYPNKTDTDKEEWL